jgi:hypothetical protein
MIHHSFLSFGTAVALRYTSQIGIRRKKTTESIILAAGKSEPRVAAAPPNVDRAGFAAPQCARKNANGRFGHLAALQIEYSLLERTVEGELIPMARELGLGVTPWSPLKNGVLSGKYSRANAGKAETKRSWVSGLDEKVYLLLDELTVVAKELDSTPARIAIAWVQGRPGVTSTIIGARTIQQLEQNLGALEVKLSPAQVARLEALSAPKLNFPGDFLKILPSLMHGGMSVNGETADTTPYAPAPGAKTY